MKIYKLEFSIDQMFDKSDDYDLFICTICFALSDLLMLNQEIQEATINPSKDNSSLYFRMTMGFIREAYELLKYKFTNDCFREKYLESIDGAISAYNEIDLIISGNSGLSIFKENKLNENRHLVFHYPKKANDYLLIQNVIGELSKDGNKFKYIELKEQDDFYRQKLDFAEAIQYNTLFGFYKINDEKQYFKQLSELATLTAKVINLLNLLFTDFISKKKYEFDEITFFEGELNELI